MPSEKKNPAAMVGELERLTALEQGMKRLAARAAREQGADNEDAVFSVVVELLTNERNSFEATTSRIREARSELRDVTRELAAAQDALRTLQQQATKLRADTTISELESNALTLIHAAFASCSAATVSEEQRLLADSRCEIAKESRLLAQHLRR